MNVVLTEELLKAMGFTCDKGPDFPGMWKLSYGNTALLGWIKVDLASKTITVHRSMSAIGERSYGFNVKGLFEAVHAYATWEAKMQARDRVREVFADILCINLEPTT